MTQSAAEIQSTALRAAIAEGLLELEQKQVDFFWRIYAAGLEDHHLADAYDLIQRTIKKNEAGR